MSHAKEASEARAPTDAKRVVKRMRNVEDANENNRATRVKAAANQVGKTERRGGSIA